jgi:hypothetical protein
MLAKEKEREIEISGIMLFIASKHPFPQTGEY